VLSFSLSFTAAQLVPLSLLTIVNEDEIISGQPLKASSLLRLVFISMIYVLKYKLTWSNSVIATFLREFSINIWFDIKLSTNQDNQAHY